MTQRRVEARSASFLLFLMAAVLRRASNATAWGGGGGVERYLCGLRRPRGKGVLCPLFGPEEVQS
jgi:hypothetical protein